MSVYPYNIDLYFVYLFINLRHAMRQGALWAYTNSKASVIVYGTGYCSEETYKNGIISHHENMPI